MVARDRALVSIDERGFRFGDGVFETIRIHDSIPFQWELHRRRMDGGLRRLRINPPREDLYDLSLALIHKNKVSSGILRISVSRGIGSRGYLPTMSSDSPPTVVIETMPAPKPVDQPVKLYVSDSIRPDPRMMPIQAKLMQGVNSTLARMEANDHDCDDAILLNLSGYVCETSSANIFWIKEDTLYTPGMDSGILPGTVRDAVIRLSPYTVREGNFTLHDLYDATEVFITNTGLLCASVGAIEPAGIHFQNSVSGYEFRKRIEKDMIRYANEKRGK